MYKLITGPLEGTIVDDGGLWIEKNGISSYKEADQDLKERFEIWCQDNRNPVNEDSWELWLQSWESEEI
jgi:hypothetical protein